MAVCDSENVSLKQLRSDQIAAWINDEWITRFPEQALTVAWASEECSNDKAIHKLDTAKTFSGYRFVSYESVECDVVNPVDYHSNKGVLTRRNGAFLLHFAAVDGEALVDVLYVATQYSDDLWYRLSLACMPMHFRPAWAAFEEECERLAGAVEPDDTVMVIGGRHNEFTPMADWSNIVLPVSLKNEIFNDVQSFFAKGATVYNRLNLKPFRKLLLAGVPGTGKTMICNALAKWALAQGYLVIYVSSAQKGRNDEYGSNFGKIQRAIDIAASSEYPTLILLEELDAYLHEEEKALILNVLDGSESTVNERGTLLIATTNYPEAIDERILKRPGRLDRIFVIPETKTQQDADDMLRLYLGEMWREAHTALVPKLVGYPGAFIREVAIHALTQVAYEDLTDVSLALLEESYRSLKAQIDARDDFLKHQNGAGFGFAATKVSGNGKHE